MTWLRKTFTAFKEWLYSWLSPPYKTIYVEDLPGTLNRKTLYIIKEDGYVEHATLVCPCGCEALLHMNLIPDEHPCWQVLNHRNGTTSLKPSVWRKIDCKSHFFFTRGRIYWCDK